MVNSGDMVLLKPLDSDRRFLIVSVNGSDSIFNGSRVYIIQKGYYLSGGYQLVNHPVEWTVSNYGITPHIRYGQDVSFNVGDYWLRVDSLIIA